MKKVIAAIAAITAGILGSIIIANPANAYPASCIDNGNVYLCKYGNTNGTDLLTKIAYSAYVQSRCYPVAGVEQETSYVANPTAQRFNVYLTSNCTGLVGPIFAHSTGAMNSTWNNNIRSIVRIGAV